MDTKPKQHGGARPHPPGREGGRPRKAESERVKHWPKRPLIALPQTNEQGYALEWWASLTPAKRLEIIAQVFNQ